MEIDFQTERAYVSVFSWEVIDIKRTQAWMSSIWWYSIPIAIVYGIVIHWIEAKMRERSRYNLKRLLFWWNFGLAVFSIIAFWRSFPELLAFVGQPQGLQDSICSRKHQNAVTAFWCLMSAWSKVVELGDTVFVVLRKQPLIFLHWYHHITVLLFTWFAFSSMDPASRWMMGMNYFIHGIMYSYYALKAKGFKISRRFAMVLTTMQTVQMVIGVCINIYTMNLKWNGVHCDRLTINVFWGTLMYFSYMVLFARFFWSSYMKKPGVKKD